jgi:hypothetical protein
MAHAFSVRTFVSLVGGSLLVLSVACCGSAAEEGSGSTESDMTEALGAGATCGHAGAGADGEDVSVGKCAAGFECADDNSDDTTRAVATATAPAVSEYDGASRRRRL